MNQEESVQGMAVDADGAAAVAERPNPFYEAPAAKKKMTLFGIFFTVAAATSFLSVISTILPIAAQEIGGTDIYAFTSTLNAVGSAVTMPLWGYIAARKPASKRMLFCASMLVGVVCILILATAQNIFVVIASGFFYGTMSAAVFVLSYTMVRDMYPPKQAGSYLGIAGAIMAAAAIAGPIVTGVAIQAIGWRAACHIFWPFIVIGCAMVLSGMRVDPKEVEYLASKGGKFDPISTLCLVVTLTAFVTALSLGSNYVPFGSLASNVLIAVAVVFGVLTVLAVRAKGDDAIIPISAVRDRDTLCFMFANLFTNFSNLAAYFFLPTYALYAMGCSAVEAALTISAFSFLSMFVSPLFGKIIGQTGNARLVLVFGTVARIVVTALLLLLMSPDMSIWLLCGVCLLGGIASASYGTGLSAGPQIQLKPELRVQGNSFIQMGQAFGNSIGLAIYTIVMATFGVVAGMRIALTISIAAACAALVFVLMLSKKGAR